MLLDQILRRFRILPTAGPAVELFGGVYTPNASCSKPTTLVYGPTIAVDLSQSNIMVVTITDGVAFVTSNPTGTPDTTFDQEVTILYRNTSGGAIGAGTFGTLYKVAGNVPAIANGDSRAIHFLWNGTNMIELWRGATDIPN